MLYVIARLTRIFRCFVNLHNGKALNTRKLGSQIIKRMQNQQIRDPAILQQQNSTGSNFTLCLLNDVSVEIKSNSGNVNGRTRKALQPTRL
jgi:hypothetical protein